MEESSLFKLIASATTAVTSLAFVWSILYNSTFLGVFKSDLLFSLSISDHILTGIYFLPYSLALFILGYLLGALLIFRPNFDGEIQSTFFATEKGLICQRLFFSIVGLILLIAWFLYGNSSSPYLYFLYWLIMGSVVIKYMDFVLDLKLSVKNRNVLFFFILICFLSLNRGYYDAKHLIKEPTKITILNTSDEKKEYNYIRQLTGGILVYDEIGISFISSSTIKNILFMKKFSHEVSLSCKKFSLCLSKSSKADAKNST